MSAMRLIDGHLESLLLFSGGGYRNTNVQPAHNIAAIRNCWPNLHFSMHQTARKTTETAIQEQQQQKKARTQKVTMNDLCAVELRPILDRFESFSMPDEARTRQ